jgi:hypothetical protein
MKRIGEISKKTELPQSTFRLCGRSYNGRITEARGRFLIVGLCPGDLLAIRPQGLGKRRTEYLPIDVAYEIAYSSRLRSERAQKLNFKKRSKR